MKHNGVILYGVNWKAAVADDTSQSLCVTSLLRLELVYHKADTTIVQLSLAQNCIGSAGAAALAAALKATLAMCFFRVRATCSSDLDSHSVASHTVAHLAFGSCQLRFSKCVTPFVCDAAKHFFDKKCQEMKSCRSTSSFCR